MSIYVSSGGCRERACQNANERLFRHHNLLPDSLLPSFPTSSSISQPLLFIYSNSIQPPPQSIVSGDIQSPARASSEIYRVINLPCRLRGLTKFNMHLIRGMLVVALAVPAFAKITHGKHTDTSQKLKGMMLMYFTGNDRRRTLVGE